MSLSLEERRMRRQLKAREANNQFCELSRLLKPGLTLANSTNSMWAVILKDASNEGCFRYQVFDENGFMSHHTTSTIKEALREAFESGFRNHDQGALEKLSVTSKWQLGLQMQCVRDNYNAGRISWDEMLKDIKRLKKELGVAT